MGKIHDALEKSVKDKDLKIVESVQPNKVKSFKPDVAVLKKPDDHRFRAKETPFIDPTLITYHHPGSVEAEIFKILRTNILFPKEGKPPRSIMVTSAIPGCSNMFAHIGPVGAAAIKINLFGRREQPLPMGHEYFI